MYSTMKSAGVWVVEPLLVLERVVRPGRRAWSPTRTSSRAPRARGASSTLPGGVVGVGADEVVDERAVQVGRGARRSRPRARRGSRRRRCGGRRGRRCCHTGMGAPQKRLRRDRPVAGARRATCRTAPSLTWSGIQLISWLSSTRRSRKSVTSHVPGRHGPVDDRRVGAPAVGVVVVVGVVARARRPSRLEVADDVGVGLEHVHAGPLGHLVGEAALVVDGHHQRRCRWPRRPAGRPRRSPGAMCTTPVPSSVSTKSPASTRKLSGLSAK